MFLATNITPDYKLYYKLFPCALRFIFSNITHRYFHYLSKSESASARTISKKRKVTGELTFLSTITQEIPSDLSERTENSSALVSSRFRVEKRERERREKKKFQKVKIRIVCTPILSSSKNFPLTKLMRRRVCSATRKSRWESLSLSLSLNYSHEFTKEYRSGISRNCSSTRTKGRGKKGRYSEKGEEEEKKKIRARDVPQSVLYLSLSLSPPPR